MSRLRECRVWGQHRQTLAWLFSVKSAYSPLRERLGEECWLLGVLTVGPTIAELNSFSREESPLPLGGGKHK